jgi:hypothetical protein
VRFLWQEENWMKKRIFTILLLGSLAILAACNQTETPPVATSTPYNANANTMIAEDMPFDENDPMIKDNFDIQRAGELLRKSNSPAEFERYLNEEDGINNLDLNGDGYVDYISVEEFNDRPDGQRGLSLFTRYGPDLIQNIGDILFYRDEPRYPGARVMFRGDDVLYGDNYYYEANWLDTTLGIVSMLFGDHDRYVSPYYYNNYPDYYDPYYVVETPYYRTRIEDMWPAPVFVYTSAAPVYYNQIRIRSPYDDRYYTEIYGRPAKPKKDQIDFRRGKPGKPIQARRNSADGPGRSENAPGQRGVPPGQNKDVVDGPASDRGKGNPGGPPKADKPGKPDNPGKPAKADNPGGGQNRGGGPDKGKGQGPGQNKGGGNGKGKGKP